MSKKKKINLNKAQRKLLKKYLPLGITAMAAFLIGLGVSNIGLKDTPSNIVWAADNTVKVPRDLRDHLSKQNDCKSYRGTGSPTGVGLWGVYQVHNAKFAKIAYGCSTNLQNYIFGVKTDNKWKLIQPTEYFSPFEGTTDSRGGAIPFCTMIEKYKIPKAIEPFCVQADGSAKINEKS